MIIHEILLPFLSMLASLFFWKLIEFYFVMPRVERAGQYIEPIVNEAREALDELNARIQTEWFWDSLDKLVAMDKSIEQAFEPLASGVKGLELKDFLIAREQVLEAFDWDIHKEKVEE